MKKSTFWLLIVVTICCSCKSCEEAAKKPIVRVIPDEDSLTLWKQSYFPKISPKDTVLFYNTMEIRIEDNFGKKVTFVQDGEVNEIDSILHVVKAVPELTPGIFVSGLRDTNGIIRGMKIVSSKKDSTYQFRFFLNDDSTFSLNSHAVVFIKGKEFKTKVIMGSGYDCRLKFKYRKKRAGKTIEDRAEGWKIKNYRPISTGPTDKKTDTETGEWKDN